MLTKHRVARETLFCNLKCYQEYAVVIAEANTFVPEMILLPSKKIFFQNIVAMVPRRDACSSLVAIGSHILRFPIASFY